MRCGEPAVSTPPSSPLDSAFHPGQHREALGRSGSAEAEMTVQGKLALQSTEIPLKLTPVKLLEKITL